MLINGREALRTRDGGGYGGACEAAGTLWRVNEGFVDVLVNNRELTAARLATTHPHSAGRMLRGSPDVFVGGATVSITERARADALAMIDNAERSVDRWNDDDRRHFREWFGSDSEETRQRVRANLRRMRERAETVEIAHAAGTAYASVNPMDLSKIEVKDKFWAAERAGPDRQGGVIVHEASHYKDTADTDDHVYGRADARALAAEHPEKAVSNADSYEYFCETTRAVP